ncbi:hypothetical protein ACHAPA_006756, partial [Fusarium lateritium]
RSRSLSILLGTPVSKATPTKFIYIWLNECINHAATNLKDISKKLGVYAEELTGQNTNKQSLAGQKVTTEKDATDAKKYLDEVVQKHTTNTKVVATFSVLEPEEGDNCPKD